ncbi:MAG: hypothetical protein ACI93R_002651 [Flavobacteriales bacterium]|jgi:hypothetical protein
MSIVLSSVVLLSRYRSSKSRTKVAYIMLALSILSVILFPLSLKADDVRFLPYRADNSTTPEYVFSLTGMSPGRKPYEMAFIRLLLNSSVDKYGPYGLTYSESPMKALRVREKLKFNRGIDLFTTPLFEGLDEEDFSIVLEFNVLRNILGYRQLVIRAEDERRVYDMAKMGALRALVAGQGEDWPDLEIYTNANWKTTTAESFQQLFPMLTKGRFDYLPLGITEVTGALEASPSQKGLIIAKKIVVYYPWPIKVLVGKKKTVLAERLNYGYAKSQANGALDVLFNKYFAKAFDGHNNANTLLYILPNPHINYSDTHRPMLLDKATVVMDYSIKK